MADPDNFADYDEKTRTQIEAMIEAERRALARRRGQPEDCDCKAGMFPNPGRRGVLFAAGSALAATMASFLLPARVEHVDAQQTVAWLHRQIAFDHEPLERVAAEYNRYAPKPIDITAPELKSLEVSGTFSEGLRTNVLPLAIAKGYIHIGTIAGKLKGVMPAQTPMG